MKEEKSLQQAIYGRRATPSFDGAPMPMEDLEAILRAGLQAPSGYNLQPWRFVVVQTAEQKKRLRAASFNQAKVEEASAPPDLSDVANLLVMTTASVTRVEDDARVRAHVASRPRPGARTAQPTPARRPPVGLALAGLALTALVLGVWLGRDRAPDSSEILWAERTTDTSGANPAGTLGKSRYPGTGAIAYPMPGKPFSNQATSPCYPELDESEINGGCWFEVARRPPCLKDVQGEYKGKCYLPISKDRGKKPGQAIEP